LRFSAQQINLTFGSRVDVGGYDKNGDGEAYNDRPNWGNRNAPINNSQTCVADPPASLALLISLLMVLSTTGITTSLDVSRNTFAYPGRQDWNLSLGKRFMMPYQEVCTSSAWICLMPSTTRILE
jgi:hypothetical protein